MVVASISLREDYWSTFVLLDEDIEFLYNHLLELEIPQTSQELAAALVNERLRREKQAIEMQRSSGGAMYFPKEHYAEGEKLIFPALNWRRGEVLTVRPGQNPEIELFEVIRVAFENGETKEYAASLAEHILNQPPKIVPDDETFNPQAVLKIHGEQIAASLEASLKENEDFVRIAGRWFPRALLVDINAGHLNLAEAVLDMAGGGPLPTSSC